MSDLADRSRRDGRYRGGFTGGGGANGQDRPQVRAGRSERSALGSDLQRWSGDPAQQR